MTGELHAWDSLGLGFVRGLSSFISTPKRIDRATHPQSRIVDIG